MSPHPPPVPPAPSPLPAVDGVRRTLLVEPAPTGPDRDDGGDHHVDAAPPLRVELTLATALDLPPARVWPLLTRPEELARWFGTVTGDLREGGEVTVAGRGGARVLGVQAPHRLDLARHGERGEEPVTLALDPEDDGTTALRLVHTCRVDADAFARSGPGVLALPWELALFALAAETDGWRTTCGGPVPRPDDAWLAGPEGAAHVRAWAVRWGAQALAAGVPEDEVRRGERETVHAAGVRAAV